MRACAPSLLHAIRGSLHAVSMLAALLEPPISIDANDRGPGEKTARRVREMQAQLKLLERRIAFLGALMAWPRTDADAVCETAGAIADMLHLLKDEAARRRISLENDIGALPAYVFANESALPQALLTCGAWFAQRLDERATLRFCARQQGDEVIFEFDCAKSTAAPATARTAADDELALLAALVDAAGGRLSTTPPLRLAFRAAPPREQPRS